MKRLDVVWLSLVSLVVAQPGMAQSIMEAGGTYAGAAGLGAGAAASMNRGKVLTKSYEAVVEAERAVAAQSKAIESYMKAGCDYEAKKQWANAQQAYTYALKVVAMRDGPGSPHSFPVLQHLVTVTRAQNEVGEAINYQKTVVGMARVAHTFDAASIISEEAKLSDLYMQKNDYASAEPVLRQSVALCQENKTVPRIKRIVTRATYAKVLRKLGKTAEADAIEATDGDPVTGSTQTAQAPPDAKGTTPAPEASLTGSSQTQDKSTAPPELEAHNKSTAPPELEAHDKPLAN